MNTSKHTPGPWGYRFAPNLTAITTPKGEIQLSQHGVYDGLIPLRCDLQEWDANGRLIAAAPDLLDELKNALPLLQIWVREHPHVNPLDNVYTSALAAIAKAEGTDSDEH